LIKASMAVQEDRPDRHLIERAGVKHTLRRDAADPGEDFDRATNMRGQQFTDAPLALAEFHPAFGAADAQPGEHAAFGAQIEAEDEPDARGLEEKLIELARLKLFLRQIFGDGDRPPLRQVDERVGGEELIAIAAPTGLYLAGGVQDISRTFG
jgi:hypothetical protein